MRSCTARVFTSRWLELRAQGWLASTPLGYVVLEREPASFFLRTRSAEFPGMKIAELFEIEEGSLLGDAAQHPAPQRSRTTARLRGLVNPSFTPRAVERYRPAMRRFLSEFWDGWARRWALRRVRRRLRQAVSVHR